MEQQYQSDRPPPLNTVQLGNCIDVMARIPEHSIDFALTDPPYITNYRGRDGRIVHNDDNASWVKPAFAEMYRTLKRDSFAVSFYGWSKADLFIDAWKSAGFRLAGHIVFRKMYTSRNAFLQYRHEQAFLLIKGNPERPACPIPDVIDMPYSGNRLHPTQKPVAILRPLIRAFTKEGDTVLDPFAGSASTLIAARSLNRNYLGIEIDLIHYKTATARLAEKPLARSAA